MDEVESCFGIGLSELDDLVVVVLRTFNGRRIAVLDQISGFSRCGGLKATTGNRQNDADPVTAIFIPLLVIDDRKKMARDERAPFKNYGIGQYGVAL